MLTFLESVVLSTSLYMLIQLFSSISEIVVFGMFFHYSPRFPDLLVCIYQSSE